MYTQCPECAVAFRVTADVLRQAAGKVRCGGCGVAFNALDHLSEEMPAAAPQPEPKPNVPELVPEGPGELEADTPPKSISAEQSAALLKTLDQLAGEDIRIEDTGIEWRVLADDEEPAAEAEVDPDDAHTETVADEMRFDDNTPLPEDFDGETPEPAPEPVVEAIEPKPPIEDSQVDLAFGDPDEWEDLLGDLHEATAPEDDGIVVEEPAVEVPVVQLSESPESPDEPPDMDTQFAIQAEAMGIDLSGTHDQLPAVAEDPEPETDKLDTSIEEDLIAFAFENEAKAKQENEVDEVAPDELSRAGILDEDDYLEDVAEAPEAELESEDEAGEPEPEEPEAEEPEAEEPEAEEPEAEAEPEASPYDEQVATAVGIDETGGFNINLDDSVEIEIFSEPEEFEVPEPTEEEMTVNMMIDQELLAIAVEDDDGFTSTIVQAQISDASDIPQEKAKASNDSGEFEEVADGDTETADDDEDQASEAAAVDLPKANPLMETIIMEGDSVLSASGQAKLEEQRRAASESLRASGFDSGDSDRDTRHWNMPGYGKIAAAVLLFLVLIGQVIHHSREALATTPLFEKTIGPIYRLVGSPVTPAWDIRGWRIEATKGSTDEAGETLTIYSRIGNNSQEALPYPLVHVAITDRFEEVIGSRVLDPGEYLAGNADPRRAVPPGENFNAVIAIDSPTENATGFKINVCYRAASSQLRCADEGFK